MFLLFMLLIFIYRCKFKSNTYVRMNFELQLLFIEVVKKNNIFYIRNKALSEKDVL